MNDCFIAFMIGQLVGMIETTLFICLAIYIGDLRRAKTRRVRTASEIFKEYANPCKEDK